MLDEKACRRPDFRGGVPIALADGQEWTLPRPTVLFVPDDGEDGFREEWSLGPEYARLIDAAQEAMTGPDIIRTELAVARHLLGLNYALDTAGMAGLLRFGYGPGASAETLAMCAAIRDVAFGRTPAPKPTPAGSD